MAKQKKTQKIEKNSTFWMSIFIIAIMILSIGGFAMSGTSFQSSNKIPDEVAFQQFETEGQIFWGAVKNKEQFIFLDIAGFDNQTEELEIATQIKLQNNINIYIDEGFESSDTIFLLEKALRGLRINSQQITTKECNSNTLILTNNESLEGNCIKFISNNEDAYRKAEIVTYYLVQ